MAWFLAAQRSASGLLFGTGGGEAVGVGAGLEDVAVEGEPVDESRAETGIGSTRLVDMVNTMDPKLVAAAFGMDPQATLIHLSDRLDETRLSQWETLRR